MYRRRRLPYALLLQGTLIGALSLLVLAFRLDWHPAPAPPPPPTTPPPNELVYVPATQIERPPPPPPRPLVPVVVPDDVVLDDIDLQPSDPIDLPSLERPPPPEPAPAPAEPEPGTFRAVEEMPALVGGLAALYEHIVYPEAARRAGLEGRVVVQFVVDAEGRVTEASVLRGVHPLLDEAALAAVRSATFTPGRQRGKAVRVRMSLPVVFSLR